MAKLAKGQPEVATASKTALANLTKTQKGILVAVGVVAAFSIGFAAMYSMFLRTNTNQPPSAPTDPGIGLHLNDPVVVNGVTYRKFDTPFILGNADATAHTSHQCQLNFQAANSTNQLLAGKDFGYSRPMATRIVSLQGTSECDEAAEMSGSMAIPNRDLWTGIIGTCDSSPGQSCNSITGTFPANAQDKVSKTELNDISFVMNRWSHSNWEGNRINTSEGPAIFTLNRQSTCAVAGQNCWSGTWNNAGNSIAISVNFDATNKVSGYTVNMTDGDDGGGAWIQGIFHFNSVLDNMR